VALGIVDRRGAAAAGGEGTVKPALKIIGAGLAGCEAAWQCARRGAVVELFEMRPLWQTPAHQTADFAELVCSNSLKSESENTAPWLLKEEMRRAGSLLLAIARECAVPAGHALAVDRVAFAARVTEAIARESRILVRREEVSRIDEVRSITIVATGPLTSDALAGEIARLSATPAAETASRNGAGIAALKRCATQDYGLQNPDPQNQDARNLDMRNPGAETLEAAHHPHLYFYDSISPIVEAESIDMERVYLAARYDKGSADYINCPMTREEYDRFYDALLAAQSVEERDWEKLNYFESCLPIEEIARRGRDTLRFGPMKPVGLIDPRTGQRPHAVVQLRQENLRADSYNLVGFQNHLRFGEQARVLRLIPGLENARFLRYGQIHRNTYINSPALLNDTLQMKAHPQVFFAGQICGVEGYVESIATGLMAGMHAAALVRGEELLAPPRASAFGSLSHYVSHADAQHFQPANITFDLLPPLEKKVRDRKERHRLQCALALREFDAWRETAGIPSIIA
jgi:methylenetetrahydrofolate--tRNA-(uracil-5-)-methyltransferase